jgi:hypothetical protein
MGQTMAHFYGRMPMYNDFVLHNWELASLIYEQSALTSKTTALTPEEKELFRVRDQRIQQLLDSIRSGSANRGQWCTPTGRWIYLN